MSWGSLVLTLNFWSSNLMKAGSWNIDDAFFQNAWYFIWRDSASSAKGRSNSSEFPMKTILFYRGILKYGGSLNTSTIILKGFISLESDKAAFIIKMPI